ncbi:protein LONGIFOLIA 1-like isoform X2 [Primulina huaijiensis]|uniref:protein LONGIFOLIA 1-like isoform X2 n=1 Tax=Primulina huaijiensis TaxID=1492673 RepID=UPI003CC72C49
MLSGKETDMPERMLNRDLQKQIGCMNGIFQLLGPNHFLAGRRVNGRNHKRLIQGAQHHLDPKNAPKAVMAEDLEVQKEKSKSSMESSRPSYSSSSSCSSMFSSIECNRTVKPESLSLRQTGMPDTRSKITAMKEQKSHDLQDVVKGSLYKKAPGLSIKCQAKDEKRCRVLKHVDSPRPLELPKYVKPKAMSAEISTRVLAKPQDRTNSSKDERPALPRFSYDGRESRETSKSTMKLKELPRLSLDSRASTMKCSALESRLDFLGCDLHMKNEKWSKVPQTNQEPGSHNRSSSLVAKLMGLESFPDNVATSDSGITNINRCPKEDLISRSSSTAENSNQNHVSYSPRITRNDPASPRLPNSNSDWKSSNRSRFPMEPAPWRQQNSSQDSPKVASHSRAASTNIQHQSSSVYGEIEKRITELEFKKSGKDLRALKRILEAMQKTRDRMDNQRGESVQFTSHTRAHSLDESCSDRNYCLSLWRDKKNHQQAFTINEHSFPNITDSSIVIMKPATVMDREKHARSTQVSRIAIQHLQRFQNQDSNRYRDNSLHKQVAEDLKARKIDFGVSAPHDPSIEKKITRRTTKVEQTLKASPQMKVRSCNTFGRSSESVNPRLTENRGRIERQFHPTTPSSDSARVKRHSIKKVIEKGSNARELNIKSTNLQLSDDQFSEGSSETRYSSNQGDTVSIKSEDNISLSSQMETEVTGIARSIRTNTKTHKNSAATLMEHTPTVEVAATMMEQPSPISVLDTTIYEEDSPSPIKKISTAFKEDESSNPDEALWNLEKLNPLPTYLCHEYNQKKLENIKHLIHERRLLKTKPDEATAKQTASVDVSPNQDHRYINKMILASRLLEDVNVISMTDQLHSSSHLINPNMFHILEQTEQIMERGDGELNRKSDWSQSSCRSHRKVVFDMVNEIYARKIASDGSFTPGRKRVSPQVLIKEIYLEVDRVQQKTECNLDEEEGLVRILNADMMSRSEDWADYGVEVPALVLDIERLIFKDLINEVVTSDTVGLQNWPKKHCRQLFRK